MRSLLVLFFSCMVSVQLSAQAYINLKGQIQNSVVKDVVVIYSSSWLDPVVSVKTVAMDDSGNFNLMLQFDENIKPANFIYGTDTLELILSRGELLIIKADGKNFLKTVKYDGTGAPNANFCLKHMQKRGMMMKHAHAIKPFYKKDILTFIKAIEADYKKEMDYLAKNGKQVTPIFSRYWRLSYEYDKYCNILRNPALHSRTKNAAIKKVIAEIPASFKDELIIIPQYRDYAVLESDMYDDAGLYAESRAAKLNRFLYLTLPSQTGEFVAAYRIYRLIGKDNIQATKQMEDFKGHFPHSRYIPLIEVKLPHQ